MAEIETAGNVVTAVVLASGQRLGTRAAIITTGTFLRALMHTGEKQTQGGRVGEAAGGRDCRMSCETGIGAGPAEDGDTTAVEPGYHGFFLARSAGRR